MSAIKNVYYYILTLYLCKFSFMFHNCLLPIIFINNALYVPVFLVKYFLGLFEVKRLVLMIWYTKLGVSLFVFLFFY